MKWEIGPIWKNHPKLLVLDFAPNNIHDMWTYCTVGMSADLIDDNLIELVIYPLRQDSGYKIRILSPVVKEKTWIVKMM